MIKKFNRQEIKQNIREKELEIIFSKLQSNYFEYALEIGSGDGFQSRLLVNNYVNKLVSTDLNRNRLIQSKNQKIEYRLVDAEKIGDNFQQETFDLIFSSNLFEHLQDPESCLLGTKKVIKNDGIVIFTVPNRFWKLLHFLLYIPSRIRYLLINKRIKSPKNISKVTLGNNLKKQKIARNIFQKIFLPEPHGISNNNFVEFYDWGKNRWIKKIESCGFQVIQVIKLPVYSPYLFGLYKIRSFFERLGFSSSYCFVIKKST